MNTVNLDIVTPNGSVYEKDDVELVVFQTTAGEIGIMSGHIPTVAALKIGHIKVKFKNGTEYIAVSGGFVVERAKLARQRAQSHLDEEDNSDINRAKRALARAENRLRVAELK